MRRFAILITTFNRPHMLERCLLSIKQVYNDRVRIQVADQSTVKECRRDNVLLCSIFDASYNRLPDDCGLSRCRNCLVQMSDCEELLLIDDDMIINKASYSDLVFANLKEFALVAIGPRIHQAPKERQPWIGTMVEKDGWLTRIKRPPKKDPVWPSCIEPTDYIPPGAIYSLKNRLIQFPFCDALKMSEGLEWCYRVNQSTMTFAYMDSEVIHHAQDKAPSPYQDEWKRKAAQYTKEAFVLMGLKGVR